MSKKILIVAEKDSVACRIAAVGERILGGFKFPDSYECGDFAGKTLTVSLLDSNEEKIKKIARKIGGFENDKYVVKFALGHLVELYNAADYNPEYRNWSKIPYPFIPDEFRTKVVKNVENIYRDLEKALNNPNIETVIIATDNDREGELIFDLIYRETGSKTLRKRLLADSMTEASLDKCMKNLISIEERQPVIDAGDCRQKADWLLGAELTAKATVKYGGPGNIISNGRVQTAVLAEIVRIENIIRNFKSKRFYKLIGEFEHKNGKFIAETKEPFDDKDKADKILEKLKNKMGKITSFEKKDVKTYCPPLYDLTSLQIDMVKFGLSADDTLNSAQNLYEKGYTTYPRTNSRYITRDLANDYQKILDTLVSVNPLASKTNFSPDDKRIVDDSKVDSHTAIIPTTYLPDLSKLNGNDRKTYDMIVKRAIAICFPPAIDETKKIELDLEGTLFQASGKVEKSQGYREVYNIEKENVLIPDVNINDNALNISLKAKEVVTQPPARYNEATLLKFMIGCGKDTDNEEIRELMKDKGIGTPATRATIIKKLFDVNYIEKKGNKDTIYPTEKAMQFIEIFPVQELKDANFTGEMEYKLKQVEKGTIKKQDFMQDVYDLLTDSIKKIDADQNSKVGKNKFDKESFGKCPVCKKGEITYNDKLEFYGCSEYKQGCKFSMSKKYNTICGKFPTEAQVKQMLEKGKSNKVTGFVSKGGNSFEAHFVIKDGRLGIEFATSKKSKSKK